MASFFTKCWRKEVDLQVILDGGRLALPQTLKNRGRHQPLPGDTIFFWFHGEGLIGETRVLGIFSTKEDNEINVEVLPSMFYQVPMLADAWLRTGDDKVGVGSFCIQIRAMTTSASWLMTVDDVIEVDMARRAVTLEHSS